RRDESSSLFPCTTLFRSRRPASGEVEEEEVEETAFRRPGKVAVHRPPPARKGEEKRRAPKLTVTKALTDDEEGPRPRSLAALRRDRKSTRLNSSHVKISY